MAAVPSKEQFVQLVIRTVRAKFPLVNIARGDQPFSVRTNGHVSSLENLYRIVQLTPDDAQHQIERWMVEMLRAAEGLPDHSAAFEEVKDRIFPMVLPSDAKDLQTKLMVSQPYVGDLVIAYALDQDRTIAYIPKPHFESWKMSVEELHDVALQNLVNKSQELAANAATDENGDVNLILFQTMDGYDASRILLPTLHERLREHLGSPFAAAIPNRDILICFRDDETVDRLKEQIASDYRSMPHQVTDRILLVTPDGVAVRA